MLSRVFVKISRNEVSSYVCNGVLARRLLLLRGGNVEVLEVGEVLGEVSGEIFVQEVYDDAYKWMVDLESGIVLRDCIILPSKICEPIVLRRGTRVYLLEAVGRIVRSFVEPGDEVYRGMKVAAIFTGKGEVRYLKSSVGGRVVYVAQVGSKPQRYLFIIAPSEMCGGLDVP